MAWMKKWMALSTRTTGLPEPLLENKLDEVGFSPSWWNRRYYMGGAVIVYSYEGQRLTINFYGGKREEVEKAFRAVGGIIGPDDGVQNRDYWNERFRPIVKKNVEKK